MIQQYLDESIAPAIRRSDALEHAIERMLIAKEGPFTMAEYLFVLNQDIKLREGHVKKMLSFYKDLNDFLAHEATAGSPFLFEDFGAAEAVYTPIFQRFWFFEYYENFELPATEEYVRVRAWREACLAHPSAQQVRFDEIIKLYYDYAIGYENGALQEGRAVSSFAFQPSWEMRLMPPKDKYHHQATDEELGLVP